MSIFPSQFGLQNFKAFGQDSQKLDFKPITLIYGKNSSGKSSIFHSLLYLHELARSGLSNDVFRTNLGEEFVDLGGFENFVHGKLLKKSITFSYEFSTDDKFSPWEIRISIRINDNQPELFKKEFYMNGERTLELVLEDGKDNSYEIEFYEESEWFKNVLSHGLSEDWQEQISRTLRFHAERKNPFNFLGKWSGREIFDLSLLPSDHFDSFLDQLVYIAGLRTVPEKSFFDGGVPSQQNINAGGMVYWDEIRSNQNTRALVNKWLDLLFKEQGAEEPRYNIYVNPYFSPTEASKEALDYFQKFKTEEFDPKQFDPKDAQAEFLKALRKQNSSLQMMRIIQDGNESLQLTAKELGVGVSQVIPLLGAACDKERFIMIEQPEIHLHPKQQADLGEVFAKSVKENGNRFIIETHSIHILERLGKMIRETAAGKPRDEVCLSPEDVGIYFVDCGKGGAKLLEIYLTPNGRLDSDFPDHFFNEDYNDLR